MAILEKRKSVKQLPRFERYQDTRGGDRAAALRGETPITSAIRQLAGSSGYGPMGADLGFAPMSGAGNMGAPAKRSSGAPSGASGAPIGSSGSTFTSALAGSPVQKTASKVSVAPKSTTAATAASKLPGLTSKTATGAKTLTSAGTGKTTAKTLTSAGTGTAKTLTSAGTGTTKGTGTSKSTGSSLSNTLTSALTGAALGAGTKAIIDKLTGAKKVTDVTDKTSGTAKDTSKVSGTGLTSKTNTLGADIGKKIVSDTGVKKVVDTTKTNPLTSVTKDTKSVLPKAPKTGGVPKTGGAAVTEATRSMAGNVAETTGNITDPINAMQGAAYDDDGNLLPGYELNEDGDPVYVGFNEDTVVSGGGEDTVVGGGGETTQTLDDGTVMTLDASGEVVSYTDTDGNLYDANGDLLGEDSTAAATDTTTTGGLTRSLTGTTADAADDTTADALTGSGYFTDEEGNVYDSDGNFVSYADGTTDEVDDILATDNDVAYTDDYGNTYDSSGDLIAEGDHSDYVYTAEDGSTYDYDGNLISEADHSDFTQQDADGNTYNWNGDLIAYADGTELDTDLNVDYNDYDDYNDYNDYNDYASDDYISDDDVGAKGGLAMAGGGEPTGQQDNGDGTITQYFDDGSTITYDEDDNVVGVTEATEDEVAPAFATRGLSARDDGDSNTGEKGDVEYFGDGSYIVYYGDGSSVTYDSDGAVYQYTSNGVENSMAEQQMDEDTSDTSTVGGLTQGNRVYYDDGTSSQESNGSITYYDVNGEPTSTEPVESSTSNPYTTEGDGDGNTIVKDSNGRIMAVYGPDGEFIPQGEGVINAKPITGAGGSGGANITPQKTVRQKIAEKRAKVDQGAAEEDWLSNLTNSLGGYGGSALAGAVLGGLLGNSDVFDSGTASSNQVDMSTVGEINPRTTDFGIGPARYVGYEDYGTPEAMPELYGNELYQNLNAPGFNEVNPGDYARMDAQMEGYPEDEADETASDDRGVEYMADGGEPEGGLGGMKTYYTFGTPVDPMQNLYNPQPAKQQAPQGMPPAQNQQMAQQAPGMPQAQNMMKPPMPQQMQQPMQAGGMRSGGLPAWSNVPVTQGRLNFRQGAAVHGAGDGQSDDIPAMLADGEYVIDAETVAQIGNGSTKAGAAALDKFRENIRMHKRSAPINRIPPKTKALTSYLKGAR